MRTGIFTTLVMAGTVLGSEIMMGAMDMGYLRARVAAVSNFQSFSGALGGAVADPVRFPCLVSSIIAICGVRLAREEDGKS